MPDTGMIRQTLYAKSGDATIAYQVSGEGPIDLVYAPGWISNVEYGWEKPGFCALLHAIKFPSAG